LADLLRRATDDEQDFLRNVLTRNIRKGAGRGLLLRALADVAEVNHDELRRAAAVSGDLASVALVARRDGPPAVAAIDLEVGVPFEPMLAQSTSVLNEESFDAETVVEQKLDGIRVQVHRDGDEVRIFTRNLNDVTARMPELVAIARTLPWSSAILDGEAIVLDETGRPVMFQESMQRFGTDGVDVAGVPLTVRFFDVLSLEERHRYRDPLTERLVALDVLPAELVVERITTTDPEQARAFLRTTLEAGHEGVLLKDPAARYEPGVRAASWRKYKPAHTLDLVVLAAEWGSGRRRGWLSNLHLGARDPDGGFVMLGKTFKGLTDQMLTWQTEQLQRLETEPGPDHHVDRQRRPVFVRPELVVEVAFDGLQVSRRYPAGLALRFARVKQHRPDKGPEDVDTIDTVRAIFEGRRLPTV
jgi:DNA ligase-1